MRKSKVSPDSPDPLRAALAKAIERDTTAEVAGLRARGAVERAQTMVAEAQANLDNAKSNLGDVRAACAERAILAVANGKKLEADRATREARLREADAEDQLQAARVALERITKEADAQWDGFRAARKDLERAVNGVLLGEVPRLLTEGKKMHDDLIGRAKVISDLISFDHLGVPKELRDEARFFVMRIQNLQAALGDVFYRSPEASRWASAREALWSDPDAPLPN